MNKGINEYKSPTPVKLYIQLGRSTQVLGNIKVPPQLNFTFNWEIDKVLGNIKVPPQLYFTFNWEDKQGIREYKSPIPVQLYIQFGR